MDRTRNRIGRQFENRPVRALLVVFPVRRYRVVGMCFLAAFICYIDRVNISVAILAMQERLGWSMVTKGWVLSSFFVGYTLFQIPGGWLTNRFGGKWVLGAAVLWWSLFTVLTPAAAFASLPLLLAARIAMGLGEGAMFPGAYGLFRLWIPIFERSRAVALLLSGVPLGTLFALTTTGELVNRCGWPSVFYVFGAVGLLWVGAWFALIPSYPLAHPKRSEPDLASSQRLCTVSERNIAVPWARLLSQPAVWSLIFNHFCSNWGLYLLLAWLPSYFHDAHGLSITSAGLLAAGPWLTMFVVINLAALLADRWAQSGMDLTLVRKVMQVTGLLGSATFFCCVPYTTTTTTALGLMCGVMGSLALTWSGFGPNHMDIAPRYADVLMGITNTFASLPGVVGVALTGWLVQITGTYAAAFTLAAAIQVAGAIVWWSFSTARPVVE
jgi:ACS family sodium-dependent inorganic phosphate cotransporter